MTSFESISNVITDVYDQIKSYVSIINLPEVRELYDLSTSFVNNYISDSSAYYKNINYRIGAGVFSIFGHFKSESLLDLVHRHFRDDIRDITTITCEEDSIYVELKNSVIDSIIRNLHYRIVENSDLKELSLAWIDELKTALIKNSLDAPELVSSPYVRIFYDDNNIGKLRVEDFSYSLETLETVRTRINDRSSLSFDMDDDGFSVGSFIRYPDKKLLVLDNSNSNSFNPYLDLQRLDDLKIYSITDLINYLVLHGKSMM